MNRSLRRFVKRIKKETPCLEAFLREEDFYISSYAISNEDYTRILGRFFIAPIPISRCGSYLQLPIKDSK